MRRMDCPAYYCCGGGSGVSSRLRVPGAYLVRRCKMLVIRGPTPTGIAFILAAALMWWGIAKNSPPVVLVGGLFVMIGVGLQVLYLRYKYGLTRPEAVR